MKASSALGLIGATFCFLNAAFTVLAISTFLNEFGAVDIRYYYTGIICLIAGLLGFLGSRKVGVYGGFSMIGASVLMFVALFFNGWLPSILLLAGGIVALREKELAQRQNKM